MAAMIAPTLPKVNRAFIAALFTIMRFRGVAPGSALTAAPSALKVTPAPSEVEKQNVRESVDTAGALWLKGSPLEFLGGQSNNNNVPGNL